MNSVSDFLTRQELPIYIPTHLNKLDRIISEKGMVWEHMTADDWTAVFTELNLANPAVKERYRNVALKYLKWLEEQGVITERENVLRTFVPRMGVNVPISTTNNTHLPNLPTLLNYMQRAIPRRSSFSGAYLGVVMSWYQLTTSETLAIRLKDVHFYIGAKEVDANVDARSITRVVIDTPNSTIHQDYALINSPDVIELVYLAYHAALPNNQHGMLLEVDGELPSANTYLRRLQRTLDHINTISGKAFTLFSIRQSGCWHAVYLAWKREGFSWKFDPSTREVFAQHANRIVDRNTTYREIFAQFVDYVAATQDEPALKQ